MFLWGRRNTWRSCKWTRRRITSVAPEESTEWRGTGAQPAVRRPVAVATFQLSPCSSRYSQNITVLTRTWLIREYYRQTHGWTNGRSPEQDYGLINLRYSWDVRHRPADSRCSNAILHSCMHAELKHFHARNARNTYLRNTVSQNFRYADIYYPWTKLWSSIHLTFDCWNNL